MSWRAAVACGVDGEVKNIIFASTGPKPDIVLRDALSNVIEIVTNSELCLFYNRSLTDAGLDWGALTDWWRAEHAGTQATDDQVKADLYRRLRASLGDNKPELVLFESYYRRFQGRQAATQPALLPQVYLHYDPTRQKDRDPQRRPLRRQRMDFLLLLPGGVRIVLEVDGKQHYAVGDVASPRNYSEMVAEDRAIRLAGYEIYRFGGHELMGPDARVMLRRFFDSLATRHQLP
jgi:very-short-patch-repair endonuclease